MAIRSIAAAVLAMVSGAGCTKDEASEEQSSALKTQSQASIPNDWITVPAGSFKRGDENGEADEKPVKDIYVPAFKLQRHGVTQLEYRNYLKTQQGKPFEAVVQCGEEPAITISKPTRQEFIVLFNDVKDRCDEAKSFVISSVKSYPAEPYNYGDKFSGDNQPVVGVDWFGAQAYCESIGGRLPTEAERERAARGVSTQDEYATSDPNTLEKDGKKLAHYGQGWGGATATVCSYEKNSFGFCDLSGNVWEWGADWYQLNAYENSETRDPKGPVNGRTKVLRGGSWSGNYSDYLRAAYRNDNYPENRGNVIGLRCAEDSPK